MPCPEIDWRLSCCVCLMLLILVNVVPAVFAKGLIFPIAIAVPTY
jgi:hypothetical protein